MNKFPLLKIYRGLLWTAALILLVLGILTIVLPLTTGRGYSLYRPDLLSLVVVSLPFFGISLGVGVIAEIITLFLQMESHLDEMKQEQKRTNAMLTSGGQSSASPVAATAPAARIRITVPGAVLYAGPSATYDQRRVILVGEELVLTGNQVPGWYSTQSGFVREVDAERI